MNRSAMKSQTRAAHRGGRAVPAEASFSGDEITVATRRPVSGARILTLVVDFEPVRVVLDNSHGEPAPLKLLYDTHQQAGIARSGFRCKRGCRRARHYSTPATCSGQRPHHFSDCLSSLRFFMSILLICRVFSSIPSRSSLCQISASPENSRSIVELKYGLFSVTPLEMT